MIANPLLFSQPAIAYAGLAGQFVIKDCDSDLENEYLPDEEHSIPFVLKDATLQSMGEFKYDLLYDKLRDHKNNLYGDLNLLNGVAWPYLPVDPITYRLRTLDVSITRPFYVKFLAVSANNTQAWLPFWVVQTDGGNLKDMIRTYSLFNAVAERYSILVNFNPNSKVYPTLAGDDYWKHVYAVNDFGNNAKAPPMFCKTHLLARFDLAIPADNGEIPEIPNKYRGVDHVLMLSEPPDVLEASIDSEGNAVASMAHPYRALRNLVPQDVVDTMIQRARANKADRVFDFGRSGGQWAVNGCTWEKEECRIIANPSRNGYELWHFKGHGGWFHVS
jgi:FtsP/CotA-like multicopper oxidase with cupredoxin domain